MRQQEKEALQARIQHIEGELASQLQDWKKLGRHALVVAGSLAAVYWLVQSLSTEEDAPVTHVPSMDPEVEAEPSVLWSVAQGVATSVALAMAKQALLQLIQKLPMSDDTP